MERETRDGKIKMGKSWRERIETSWRVWSFRFLEGWRGRGEGAGRMGQREELIGGGDGVKGSRSNSGTEERDRGSSK